MADDISYFDLVNLLLLISSGEMFIHLYNCDKTWPVPLVGQDILIFREHLIP